MQGRKNIRPRLLQSCTFLTLCFRNPPQNGCAMNTKQRNNLLFALAILAGIAVILTMVALLEG